MNKDDEILRQHPELESHIDRAIKDPDVQTTRRRPQRKLTNDTKLEQRPDIVKAIEQSRAAIDSGFEGAARPVRKQS